MTKKMARHAAPWAWEGAADNPVFHRELGADLVINGAELVVDGAPAPPLHRWFDRTRPVYADKVGRLFCHCGAGPVGVVQRVWQASAETVALLEYSLRRRLDRGDETTLHRAVLHLSSEVCTHGALLLHPADNLTAFCGRHVVEVPGSRVVDVIRTAEGSWTDSGPANSPNPRCVVLH